MCRVREVCVEQVRMLPGEIRLMDSDRIEK